MSDAVAPVARAPIMGVYRFWRDMGCAVGAVIAGTVADALGYGGAIAIVAGLTAASGLWVLHDIPATSEARSPETPKARSGTCPDGEAFRARDDSEVAEKARKAHGTL
jgi:hypothetical protein